MAPANVKVPLPALLKGPAPESTPDTALVPALVIAPPVLSKPKAPWKFTWLPVTFKLAKGLLVPTLFSKVTLPVVLTVNAEFAELVSLTKPRTAY